MKNLLIAAHTPSPNTVHIAKTLENAAKTAAELQLSCLSPFEVEAQHLLAADGMILFTTENFGYMSGAMKDMFDRLYYQVYEQRRGLPYALVVRAGKDGTGACRSVHSITKGLGWKAVQSPLVLQGDFQHQAFTEQAATLAAGVAIALAEGMI